MIVCRYFHVFRVFRQMGCSCRQCDTARLNPGYKDGMVACLGVVDELEGKVHDLSTFIFHDEAVDTPSPGGRAESLGNMI